MSTEFFNDQWRIPSNENQNKVSNYSMDLDGTNYVQIGPPPNNTFLQPSEAELNATGYSVSAWIKIDSSFASTGGIFANDGIPQTGRAYGLEFTILSTRALRIDKGDGTGRFSADIRRVVTTETVPLNAWTHVAFVLPSATNTTWQIYINGVASTLSTGGSGGAVGYSPNYSGGIGRRRFDYFNGKMDQVTVFDYALSQDQVTQLGATGYAFNFTGANSENINLGTTPFSFTQNLTVSFWAKFSQTATNSFLGKDNNTMTGGRNWMIYQVASQPGQISFWTTTDGATASGYQIITSNTSINNNEWHHVVCINDYTNGTKQIYIDGSLDITNNEGATISTSSAMVQIGNRDTNPRYPYDGQMSNVAFFDTAFTASQVQTLYNNGKPGDISSLNPVAWYKLDDTATFNSGTSVWSIPDASTNSNTGASVGMNASNLVASNINGELIANPMATSPKPIAYYQLGDQSVSTGPTSSYLVPNNSLSDYVFNFVNPSDGINVGSSNVFNFGTGDFTISMWFKINSFPTNPYLFDFRPTSSPSTDAPGVYISTATNQVSVFGGGTIIASSAGKILATGVWYNFVVKRTGNTFTTHYDGGSADQTGTSTVNFNTDLEVHIGSRHDNINGFDGEISNFQVFNTALPQTGSNSIETIYNNGSPLTSMSGFNSLQAWYKLNASEIFNRTSTEWSVDNNAYPSVYKSSLNFDGNNDTINLSNNSVFNLGTSFTISGWFNFNYTNATKGLISFDNNPTRGWFLFTLVGTNKIRLFDGTNAFDLKSSYTTTNQWDNFVVTYDGTDLVFYINGIQESTQAVAVDLQTNGNDGQIGNNQFLSGRFFDGEISNLALWNVGLTSPQVTTLYNNGTPEASISHSPVSWYKLDNITTGIQDSAGSNNGTNNGATEYAGFVNALAGESVGMDSSNLVVGDLQQTSGYSPYALDFDGADDYLNGGNINSFEREDAFSGSCWVNLTGSDNEFILSKQDGSTAKGYMLYVNVSRYLIFYITSNSTINKIQIRTNSTVVNNTWNHLAFTWSGSGASSGVNIYINGVNQSLTNLGDTFFTGSIVDATIPFQISGRDGSGASGVNGSVSNVSMFDYELTSTQVIEIYNEGVPSDLHNFSGTAPITWWQLGSNSSFNTNWTCLDEIGTNNLVSANMTNDDIVDGPGYSASGVGGSSIDIVGDAPYSTANGLSENMDVLDRTLDTPITNTHSIQLDGIDDYIDCGDSNTFSFGNGSTDSPFSISAWINMTDATRFRIVNKGSNFSNDYEYLFTTGGSDTLALNLYDSGARIARKYNTALTSFEGQWIHVVSTYDGTSSSSGIKLYLNGSILVTASNDLNPTNYTAMENTTNVLEIGAQASESKFANGKIDEVAMFNSELSASQVSAIYNNGTPNNILPLNPVSWHRFESLTTSSGVVTTADSSGNGLTGTVENGASLSTEVP